MDRSNEEGCRRPKFKDEMEIHLKAAFKRKLVEGEYDNDVDQFMFSILGKFNIEKMPVNLPYLSVTTLQIDDSTMRLRECRTANGGPGVMIGDNCFDSSKICRKLWNDEMGGYFFHPDHISLCRNKTYWDEERSSGFCGEGWHQCRGNWPGFCARDNNEKGKLCPIVR